MKGNRKAGKQPSIRRKIFIPTMAVILSQTVIFTVILVIGGIFRHADRNAYTMLHETCVNRKNYLEAVMLNQWSQLDGSAARINKTVEALLSDVSCPVSDIASDRLLDNQILTLTMEELVNILKRNYVNECFLILNTQDSQLPCTYLSNTNPEALEEEDASAVKTNLTMKYGLSSLASEYGISFNPMWQVRLPVGDLGSYYEKAVTAPVSESSSIRSLGFWSACRSSQDQGDMLFYSVPLAGPDHTVYGVLGVGISADRLLSVLPYEELNDKGKGIYLLTRVYGKGNYKILFSSGPSFGSLFEETRRLSLPDTDEQGICSIRPALSASPFAATVQTLNIYSSDSLYFADHWALISLIPQSELLSFSRLLKQLIAITGLLSCLLGVCIIAFSSAKVAKPVKGLAREVAQADPQKSVSLHKTGILEIDQLSHAVESLSRDLVKSASRLSKLIHTVNIGIGAFELDRLQHKAFVSGGLFGLLHLDEEDTDRDRIMEEGQFLSAVRPLSSYQEDDAGSLYSIPDKNGKISYIRLSLLHEENTIIGIIEDITAEITEKKKIEYERDYDILTGLLNRRAFQSRVSERLHNREALRQAAMLVLDMDNLKYINDTYGHDFGDEYIKLAADAIRRIGCDSVITSRPSGDEFYLFFWGFEDTSEIRHLADRLWGNFKNNHVLLPDGMKHRLRASGGLAWYGVDSVLFDELIKFADFAMYSVKKSSKGTWAEFDKQLYSRDAILFTGTAELNRIIESKRILYSFQPIVDIRKGEIYGYEALMRPQSNLIPSPLDIIRIARAEAKLYHIEQLTLEKSLETFDKLIKAGLIPPDRKIFINSIANYCLSEEDFKQIINSYGGYFKQVVIEILENDEIIEELFLEKRNTIKKYGGQIALDDFGTGYNSEYALLSIEPELVKIDISIVRHIDQDTNRQNMLKGLLGFTRAQNIRVLAEGVETAEELRTLISFGVDYVQGYYLGRPQFEPAELTDKQRAEILSCQADERQKNSE